MKSAQAKSKVRTVGPLLPSKDVTRNVVLEVVRRSQPISRVQVARLTGLQRSTVSAVVDGLLQEGWIQEGSILKTARGRRPTMLSMSEQLLLLAADVRPTQAILAVVDLNGRFLDRAVVPVSQNPQEGARDLVDGFQQLQKRFPGKSFEGAGISLPGRVDRKTQAIAWAPNLPWMGFDLRSTLQAAMGMQVEMENAANAALLSEAWFGQLTDDVAVLLTVSEGLGCAVWMSGKVQEGANGLAGELGHVPLFPNKQQCSCGLVGCWETEGSSRAALRHYATRQKSRHAGSIQELLSMASAGDKQATEALKTQARALGYGLKFVLAAYDPRVLYVVGDVTLHWKLVGPIIAEELGQGLKTSVPRIVPLPDGEAARLRGGAALVLQRHTRYGRPHVP